MFERSRPSSCVPSLVPRNAGSSGRSAASTAFALAWMAMRCLFERSMVAAIARPPLCEIVATSAVGVPDRTTSVCPSVPAAVR
jgi:hypothetical protein